ncbi:MAG: LegC family aminotransferase [Flavobacteriales bacterium]|jgi:aminotransferase in exopolysaccharide biosynthesis|nr:LegC family aminotransferase [Flavobacteriales bacterium]
MKHQRTIEFIKETFSTQEFIPLHAPTFGGNEKKYLNECIDSTFVSSVGKFVDQFEQAVADYTGAKQAVVCVNGTNALQIAMIALGVEQDDEVITQALTFIATANAISYLKAAPIFIDVDKETMGLSPKALSDFLDKNADVKNGQCYNKVTGKRIKACIPMHTFGFSCKIDEIAEICNKYCIELIEDSAESLGTFYKGKSLGTFGKIGAISFNGNKIMTTGGGGILITDDENLAKRIKHLTTQAKVPHPWEYTHDAVGYNFRMPNLNAALGLAQLEQLPSFLKKKRTLTEKYRSFFEQDDQIHFKQESENETANYWLNTVILPNRKERDQFLEETNKNGVMTRPIWTLMNKMPMFENCQKDDLTNSQWLEDRVVNIPSSVIL